MPGLLFRIPAVPSAPGAHLPHRDKMVFMKTIICSEEQKNLIWHRLLKESGAPVITDVQLLSPSNILRQEEPADEKADALRLSKQLKRKADAFPIFRAMFRFPAFIQEILSFAKECALYGISPDTLPADTASERELAGILSEALTLPLKEKAIAAGYPQILSGASRLSPAEFSIRFEADPFRARFLRDLRNAIPDSRDVCTVRPCRNTEIRYAPGVRQEIEACAQDIVRRGTPCAVVLCSYETQLPVLRQVFERYEIPYSAVRESFRPAAVDIYLSLAHFALFRDRDSFLACLETDAFAVHADSRLIRHFRAAMTDDGFRPLAGQIDEELFGRDQKKAATMDQNAARFLSAIEPVLTDLRSAASPSAALSAAFEALRVSGITKDPGELGAALALRNRLNQTLPLVESEEDALFVLQEINALGGAVSEPQPSFCMVTDLSHPSEPAGTLYVLGCSGKQYPGVPLRKGLFDEPYAAKVPGYPPMEERHALWTEQLSWLENSSDTVIYSYAASDYQGREIQPAFDIISKPVTAVPWKLEKVKPAEPRQHSLLPETAQALYETDGQIHSSVSRIERWFNCPYSWFIESGLKVRKEQTGGLDQASIGTLQHAVMEHAAKIYKKDYFRISEEEIREFLKPAFESLRAMRPDEEIQASLSEERMVHSILQTMQFLKETEEAAPSWAPEKAEEHFDESITEHVLLNGCIDRIDYSGPSLRILDYKSSRKTLSEKKIKAGLQLQLLSYLIVACRRENRRPAGAFYISMKAENGKSEAGSFGKTNKNGVLNETCSCESSLHEAMVKERRINGWSFDDSLISDADYKRLFSPGSGQYSYEAVEQCISELYEYFHDHACGGDIAVDPVAGACTFCDYKAICRHHLPPRASKEIVMKDIPLKKGKEAA